MHTRLARVGFALTAFALVVALTVAQPAGEAVAQPKGFQKGRAREKEVPPPALTLPDAWAKAFTWRSIGPANMSGRITAISVYEADPSTYWVATASGGLLKTTNNGVTFEHQFDKEATVSIGDVCVATSDKNVVWVGTGENNPRNSVSFGDGVYKSTDGGKTWKHMGLKGTYQTGKILVHPTNPDVVYVGALGRLYGPNEDRGLFKTSDGGKTWDKVLYTDANTGVIDARMHPTDPDTLFVAMWERRRDGFDSWPGEVPAEGYDAYDPVKKWGPSAGIYKTTDGGKTFNKLTKGLPTSPLGRIGLDIHRKDPNVLFAIVDCEAIGKGPPGKKGVPAAPAGYVGVFGEDAGDDKGAKIVRVTAESPAEKAGLKVDDVVTKIGDKAIKGYDDFTAATADAKVGDKTKFAVTRGDKQVTIDFAYGARPTPEGRRAARVRRARRGDRRAAVLRVLRRAARERHHPGPGRAPVRRHLQEHRRRRELDPRQQPEPAADVLQPGARRSDRPELRVRDGRQPARVQRRRARPSAPPAAASTPTTTRCGSTRRTGGTRSSAPTAGSTPPTTAGRTGTTTTTSRSASSTTSRCATRSRTGATAGCRTTGAGGCPARAPAAGR
jgi:hypothetical protein